MGGEGEGESAGEEAGERVGGLGVRGEEGGGAEALAPLPCREYGLRISSEWSLSTPATECLGVTLPPPLRGLLPNLNVFGS